MPELRLHHVSYPVTDLNASAAFYEGLLGLSRLRRPAFSVDGLWLACGDRQVHLVLNPSGTFRKFPAVDPADVHLAFWTNEFEAMVSLLEEAGYGAALPEHDPKRMLVMREGVAGFPQLYVLDPDFNTVEVNAAPME